MGIFSAVARKNARKQPIVNGTRKTAVARRKTGAGKDARNSYVTEYAYIPVNQPKRQAPARNPAPAAAPAPKATPYKPTPLKVDKNKVTPPPYDPSKDKVLQSYQKQLDQLKAQTAAGNKQYRNQINSLTNTIGNQNSSFEDLQSQYANQLKVYRDAQKKYDRNYNSLQSTNAGQLAKSEAQWRASLNEQQKSSIEKYDAQTANFTGQLNKQKSEYVNLLKASQSAFDEKYAQQTSSFDSRFNQMVTGYEDRATQQTNQFNKRYQSQGDEFNKRYQAQANQFTETTARYDGMIDDLKIENSKNLSNMDAAFRASMTPLSQSAVGIKSKKSRAKLTGSASTGTNQLSRSNSLQIANLNL